MQPVDTEKLRELLGESSFWANIEVRPSVTSTNAIFAENAAQLPTGSVLIADHQTVGRGRFDRSWVDTPGRGLATSALLRPSRPMSEWGWLPLLVGLAVDLGTCKLAGDQRSRISLKWPNDVLIDGRKICGILCQVSGDALICGWGINVLGWPENVPAERSNCLADAGLPTDRTAISAAALMALEDLYLAWENGEDMRERYLRICDTLGRKVKVLLDAERPDAFTLGKAVDVTIEGNLVVETDAGLETFSAGDVIHLR